MHILAMLSDMIEVEGTTETVLAALPTDPASIFVYVLLIVAFGAMWWANRRSSGASGEASESKTETDAS